MNIKISYFIQNKPIFLFLLIILACHTYGSNSIVMSSYILQVQSMDRIDSSRHNLYIVKKYDTMWDLSFKFFGDPFRWPQLWQANTYIQDPHWIYPGNSLKIPQRYNQFRNNALPVNQHSQWDRKTHSQELIKKYFTQYPMDSTRSNRDPEADSETNQEIFHLLKKDFFTSHLLQQSTFLWTEPDKNNLIAPGNAYIDQGKESRGIYNQYDRLTATIFDTCDYQPGDTVEIFHLLRYIKYNDNIANLVKRVAIAEILTRDKSTMEVKLLKIWGKISNNDRVAPLTRFRSYVIDTVTAANQDIEAAVFEYVEETASPHLFQSFVIDRGAVDGVKLGDLFLTYHRKKKEVEKNPSIIACAVHVGKNSSTLFIIKMFKNSLAKGDVTKLYKRMVLY